MVDVHDVELSISHIHVMCSFSGKSCLWDSVANLSPPGQPALSARHRAPPAGQRRRCGDEGSAAPHATGGYLQLRDQVRVM